MLQTYFTDTIESKFIKELLLKTPLPIFPTKKDGDFIVKDFQYVYGESIIKCEKTGYISYSPIDNGSIAKFVEICDFTLGLDYFNVTQNHVSRYTYYDTNTHERLGEFLRAYRDIKGVDLLPYYNCFSYRGISGVEFDSQIDNIIVGNNLTQYKLICAPIRFNTTYTISIDCQAQVIIFPLFYDDQGILKKYKRNENETTILHKAWCESKAQVYNGLRFKHPITYSVDMLEFVDDDGNEYDEETCYNIAQSLESVMYLVIQLPIGNNSSILIQEGDYTNQPRIVDGESNTIYSMEGMTSFGLNKVLQSPLSLQRMSTGTSYAFSNRLIEYLLKNVIDIDEKIGENIEKAQNAVDLPKGKFTKGVWNDLLRISLYNKFIEDVSNDNNKRVEFVDINGFVDKDTEYLLKVEE